MNVLGSMAWWCLFILFASMSAQAAGSVVLWNKLGSQTEIENSEIGPNGSIYNGPISFNPGRFSTGFTSRGGRGKSGVNFGLWENINPDYDQAGTVEFWWKTPRAYNEPHSTPDELFVSGLWSSPFKPPFQLLYRWRDHNGIGGFEFRVEGKDGVQYVYRTGKIAPFEAGDLVHVAFVWDINGLSDDPDIWYGAYVDGQYYPLTDVKNPGASINAKMNKPSDGYFAMGYYNAD